MLKIPKCTPRSWAFPKKLRIFTVDFNEAALASADCGSHANHGYRSIYLLDRDLSYLNGFRKVFNNIKGLYKNKEYLPVYVFLLINSENT